jgi:hypothetical protein
MNVLYTIFIVRVVNQKQSMIRIQFISEYVELKIPFAEVSNDKLFLVLCSGSGAGLTTAQKIVDAANG